MRLSHQCWLNRIVLKNCLKLPMSHAGSLSSSGSEFQTIGPATGKAQRTYMLSRQHGTVSRCGYAERNRCWDVTLMAGMMSSASASASSGCSWREVGRKADVPKAKGLKPRGLSLWPCNTEGTKGVRQLVA